MDYYYIQIDENGLIFSQLQSSAQKSPEQTELIQVDSIAEQLVGRYYLNGEVGPAPSEGYRFQWNADSSQFEEVLNPTE